MDIFGDLEAAENEGLAPVDGEAELAGVTAAASPEESPIVPPVPDPLGELDM